MTTCSYHADDQIHTILTPDPDPTRSGPGYEPQLTTHHYDPATGRLDRIVRPDGGEVHYAYHPDGKLHRTWGAGTYPQQYTYDAQGRLKTLTTWQGFDGNFASATGAATTTWNYHPQRGWLSEKVYDDQTKASYSYHADGKLQKRSWQRQANAQPLETTYSYTVAGDLETVTYSDGTPGTMFTHDRLGRVATRTDAAGLATLTYEELTPLATDEVYSGTGLLAGLSLTRSHDTLLRMQGLTASGG